MSRVFARDRVIQKFGKKLRTLRLQQKLTLQELAHELGYVAHGYISEIESGKKKPTADFVLKVADFFDVTTDKLLRDELRL